MNDEPLFESAHQALKFAFAYSARATVATAPIVRMMRGPMRAGKGLVGMDGAAQSALIRAQVEALTAVHRNTSLRGSRYIPPRASAPSWRSFLGRRAA